MRTSLTGAHWGAVYVAVFPSCETSVPSAGLAMASGRPLRDQEYVRWLGSIGDSGEVPSKVPPLEDEAPMSRTTRGRFPFVGRAVVFGDIRIELKALHLYGSGSRRARRVAVSVAIAGAVEPIGTMSVRAAAFTEPPVTTYQELPLSNAIPSSPAALPIRSSL